MSRENYWAEREAAKTAALKMAAKLTAREKGLVVTATKRALVNEAVHDQTLQRKFERGFLSLDATDDEGRAREYSFGSREQNRMIRKLDAPYWEHVRELRFRCALYRLRRHPELQQTLLAIHRHLRRQKNNFGLENKGRSLRHASFPC